MDKLAWRMLALLIFFCRLPFPIVENPFFKVFVWLLDATVLLPMRRKLCDTLLPDLHDKGKTLKRLLARVKGVAITLFDMGVSRKREDNLSLDNHFIYRRWRI
eukprot:jgi/Tetstr1/461238/TSEL_006368.t1